jgi:superfamily II DNA/RNA helicase
MKKVKNNEFYKFGIKEDVCKALDIMKYYSPTIVQEKVIEPVLDGKDLIVQSKTGSGKTAAFGIPVVNTIDVEERSPQVLVLTPTRELAVQVCEEISEIGKYKKIRCLPIYGKQPIYIQLRQLKQRVHVAVGTPGRVSDLIKKKHLKLDAIKYLVIDEADELLNRGFLEEVTGIIKKVPVHRSTLLFSATMPPEIEGICSDYMNHPTRIEIQSQEEPINQIKQCYYQVSNDWKLTLLTKLLKEINPDTCMIFCNTRAKVDQVVKFLNNAHYKCTGLHGKMAQKFRLRAISDFKNKNIPIMVATDLAGRGIHIDKLSLVINYNVPSQEESYIHRIGRTGRVGEKGKAITFVSEHEKNQWEEVQKYIGYKVLLSDNDPLTSTNKNKITNIKNSKAINNKTSGKIGANRKSPSKKYKDIDRIRINAGKKKKMRPGDILGALSNLNGLTSDDIGIIDIQDSCSYIEIHNKKGSLVMKQLPNTKVKGRFVTVKKVKI